MQNRWLGRPNTGIRAIAVADAEREIAGITRESWTGSRRVASYRTEVGAILTSSGLECPLAASSRSNAMTIKEPAAIATP